MKILKAQLDWMGTWSNTPDLRVLVEGMPDRKLLRYQQHNYLYYAHLDGLARFYHYARPGEGFGGRIFEITLQDGTVKNLKGPWSSNSGSINRHFNPHCVEVAWADDGKWNSTFVAGAMTVEFLKEQISEIEIVGLQTTPKARVDDIAPLLPFNKGKLIMIQQPNGIYQLGIDDRGVEYYKCPFDEKTIYASELSEDQNLPI